MACYNLRSIPKGGLPSTLETLIIWDCSKLVAQHGHWGLEGLTSLKTLDINDCNGVLDSFPARSLPVSLTSFQFRGTPRLQKLERKFSKCRNISS
ncbi:LRR domain containing protein [Parasponia andersonii]|uniref:LRR domain containing protein n=1 Tax=Parasponia andersonii TaxID=3476 RepID=A0A2P5DM79_PARAD|nr:LRR domain containing protein [Parasponia andersonii]